MFMTWKPSTKVLERQPQNLACLWHLIGMDINTRQIVAANVKRLRLARGMTQTALGEKSGTGQTTVSSVERPDGKNPTLETLALLAKTLEVPDWTLLVDGSALDAAQLKALDVLVHTYAGLPSPSKDQVQRVAEAESRYARAS